jgi:hypothetical protein
MAIEHSKLCDCRLCCQTPLVQIFVHHNPNTITDFLAIVHRNSPSPPVKHESLFRRIGDETKVALRPVCPRPHRLHTMNDGVYEPLSGRPHREVLSHYDCTTFCHRWARHAPLASQKLPGAPSAASSKPAGECDEHEYNMGINGDCIAEENCKWSSR